MTAPIHVHVRRMWDLIPIDKERAIRTWAAQNAFTLLFIAAFFVVTWILILIDIIRS